MYVNILLFVVVIYYGKKQMILDSLMIHAGRYQSGPQYQGSSEATGAPYLRFQGQVPPQPQLVYPPQFGSVSLFNFTKQL